MSEKFCSKKKYGSVKLVVIFITFYNICRSSRPEVFCKKGVLRNFTKFTGKHLCQSLILKTPVPESHFNKVAGLRPATLLKRDSGTGVFL